MKGGHKSEADPEKGHKDYQRFEAEPFCEKKVKAVGLAQLGKEKCLGRPHCSLSELEGSLERRGRLIFFMLK